MAEALDRLELQVERLTSLLAEDDYGESWTVSPVRDKGKVIVTAERGTPNEEGWARTSVVLPLGTLEALDDEALVRQVRIRVKAYRMGW